MNNLQYLPILILPFGCIGISSSIQVLAIVIFLYLYYYKRVKFDLKSFFNSYIVKYSFILFSLWIVGMRISDIILKESIKESWNFFQRILPFILVGLFTVKNKRFFEFAWIAITTCLLIIDCNVFYNFIEQGHWRPVTMFNNPNRLGAFLILLLPFVFAGTLAFKEKFNLRIYGSIVFILGFMSLIIAASRGALLGIIVGVFVCFAVIKYKKINLKKFLFSIFTGIFICILGAFAVYMIFPEMISRSYDMERVYLWQSAIRIFIDYPILGVGGGNFNDVYLNGYINPLAHEPNLVTPHNVYLWLASERGIITVVPFILMIIYQIYTFCKNIFVLDKINIWACCGLIMVIGMAVHGLVDTTMNNRTYQMMYWFLYGISCYSIVYKEKKE